MRKISKCERDRLVDYFRTQSVCECAYCRRLREQDLFLPEQQWAQSSLIILCNLRAFWRDQEDG